MKIISIRRLAAIGLFGCIAGCIAGGALAQQPKTEITLARFFGSCEADYGKSTDVKAARGECGVITTLVNNFNATNKDNIVVKPQIAEWGPYYDQLTARIVARDVPAIAVMHESSLGDFVNRKLL
ncbi:MAG: extracellular solute-binding protein family 1, partial [Variovorax sp.]|nr:extracellular solute-binding protein family 1 [Variovorax sp.]